MRSSSEEDVPHNSVDEEGPVPRLRGRRLCDPRFSKLNSVVLAKKRTIHPDH
jgi:hypothetical protein